MSDYLSRLAARTVNIAQPVQPRTPSRFEPGNALGYPHSSEWQRGAEAHEQAPVQTGTLRASHIDNASSERPRQTVRPMPLAVVNEPEPYRGKHVLPDTQLITRDMPAAPERPVNDLSPTAWSSGIPSEFPSIAKAVSSKPIVSATASARGIAPLSDRIAVAGEPQSSPTINVTIGRIEVRAMMPATQPMQRAQPMRAYEPLSLSEYLKQRGEGRR